MVAIFIFSIIVIVWIIPQIDDKFRESYLLYSILVVEMIGMLAMRYFQVQDKQSNKKIGHTERLLEKVFKPMLNITTKNYDNRTHLVISKLSFNEQMIKLVSDKKMPDDDFYEIEKLPYPYYDWAISHMQKYDVLKDSIFTLKHCVDEINECHSEMSKSFDEKIQDELSVLFPEFFSHTIDISDDDLFFYFPQIRTICENYILYDEIDPIIVNKWEEGMYVLYSQHNGRRYLMSKDKSKLDVSKFMKLLKNVASYQKTNPAVERYLKSYNKYYEQERKFKKNLALIVEKLDTNDIQIKGSCEGCK